MTEEATTPDRNALLTKAYGKAVARLKAAHLDEFHGYQAEEAKALGIEWKPKQTPQQKAAAEIARLLAENPGLAETFGINPDAPQAAASPAGEAVPDDARDLDFQTS